MNNATDFTHENSVSTVSLAGVVYHALTIYGLMVVLGILLLAGCTTAPIQKIALVAPFEGRYREIGYDALYAARLAIQDSGEHTLFLLAVDDGGSIATARDHAASLAEDSSVAAVIVLGQFSADSTVQIVYPDVPTIIVGHWYAQPMRETVYMLANPSIDGQLTFTDSDIMQATSDTALVGNELLALRQFAQLRDDLSGVTVLSSGSLPSAAFEQRYLASAQFAEPPSLLAPLTYDATAMVIEALQTNTPLNQLRYNGLNGDIRFEDGYWVDAPINTFSYTASSPGLTSSTP